MNLRPDPSPDGAMSFLAGASEMARMIRARDWSGHSFGPPEIWPQSLRSALSICLHSAFPTAIYWGAEFRLLYNDAWSTIPGPRHPAALGAPAREVWADIWPIIGPQFEAIRATGEGLFLEDQRLPMARFGAPEETYWSYSLTAIRGEDGTIAGVFNSGSETTRSVLARGQMRFLLQLNETLRATGEPEAARHDAAALLGAHLGVDRVGFAALRGDTVADVEEWTAPGVAPTRSGRILSDFGAWLAAELRAGRVVRIDDVARDPHLAEDGNRRAFAAIGAAAVVVVPWMERGALAGAAYLHATAPRDWNDFDIATLEEVLERTHGWMQRRRAEERERIMTREIDHRARNVLAVAQSVVRLTSATGAEDFRAKVEARIAALARAHTLLAAERWSAIDLAALVAQELAPYAKDGAARVRAEGPAAALPPDMAQSLALVVHKLATNAAKHGALGAPGAALDVTWRIDPGGLLRLDWSETLPRGAATPAAVTAAGTGFGSTLLRRVVEAQLGGSIAHEVTPGGLRCRIAFALNAGAEAEAAPAAVAPAPAAGAAAAPRRILIAEDEALVAMDLEDIVLGLGHAVFGVYAAFAEALAAIETDRPDLAILDANLRGGSSLPLAERLHALGVPVIFASGYGAIGGLPAALADAPRLAKPFAEAAVAAEIARALG